MKKIADLRPQEKRRKAQSFAPGKEKKGAELRPRRKAKIFVEDMLVFVEGKLVLVDGTLVFVDDTLVVEDGV